jgi:hypothetical protein
MLQRYFQKLWSAIVTGATFARNCLNAIGDAINAAAIPLAAINKNTSLAHAAKAVTNSGVSQASLTRIGINVSHFAAKGAVISKKLGFIKMAGVLFKVSAFGSLPIGTTIVAAGLTILFVGVVWLLLRGAKTAKELIETASSGRDARDLAMQLLAA